MTRRWDTQGPCARCGRDPAMGIARIGDAWYCHDDDRRPSCYEQTQWDGNMNAVAVMPPGEVAERMVAHPLWAARIRRTGRRLWRQHGPSVRVDFNGPWDRTLADDDEWLLIGSATRLTRRTLSDNPQRWVGKTVLAYDGDGLSCVATVERVRPGVTGEPLLSLRLDRTSFMDHDPEADR